MGFFSALDPVAYLVRRNRRKLRARAGLERKSLTLDDGLEIVYLDGGGSPDDARRPLMLLHGIGASKDHWPRVARRLGDRFRIVAPDLPGFGESSRPLDDTADGDARRHYGTGVQARTVRRFAQALGLERVHLGGSSMGGRIAAVFAGQYPEALRSLWLLAPSGVAGSELSEMLRRVDQGERIPIFSRTAEEYKETLAFAMHDPPDIPEMAYRVLAAEIAPHFDLNRRIFDVLTEEHRAGLSTEDAVRGLRVPTLVAWGAEDRVLDASGAAPLAEALAGPVTVRRMDGVGHLPMMEDAEATARGYLAFQDEHVKPNAP